MKKLTVGVVVLALSLLVIPNFVFANESPSVSWGPGAGFGMGRGSGMMRSGGGYGMMGNGYSYQVADVLGMDVNDVLKEIQAGKSYVEIAKAKGVKQSVLEEKLLAAHKARLDEYVKAGSLTPEQAKWMQDNMALRVKSVIEYKYDSNSTWGPGFRGGRRCGGFGPSFNGGTLQ